MSTTPTQPGQGEPQGAPEAAAEPAPVAAQPAPPAPAPPARKKTNPLKIVVPVLVALLAIGGIAYTYFNDGASAKVGDCASVSGNAKDAKYQALDCGNDKATYKVAKVLENPSDSCPSGDYDTYTQTARRGKDFKLCLMPNLQEGSCYKVGEDGKDITKVACGAEATIKISKVVRDKADEAACGDDKAFAYPEPATTFCLTQP
ncbi:LppU/SCO3897 family protein [Streptoalloteichus hindustanus]|uniref:Uncharacterized protein n=1 Tax=Streptoalloteichus hindustanus TaxID=2017 RepID=A0A1M4WBS9_STRHI|nr:hypothetical protein [Streptoalloteichus hindustanus]SHE78657.1 hypothetical protein SAMN05444320_1011081 [Streptoalloteichus hindustanus]